MVTWLCVGNYAIHSYINAVLRKSFRHKNISVPLVNCAGKKKGITRVFPFVDPGKLCSGIWGPWQKRAKEMSAFTEYLQDASH